VGFLLCTNRLCGAEWQLYCGQEHEKWWADRYEELRVQNASEMSLLQEEIKELKVRCGEMEKELRRASHDVDILREQKVFVYLR